MRSVLQNSASFRSAVCLAAIVVASAASISDTAHAADAAASRKIKSFALPDHHGRQIALSDFGDSRAVVVCFLGTQCPLAKFYGPRLQMMSDAMQAKGVAFIGINSNMQDSLAEVAAYARRHKITFPILKDLRNRIAERFEATRTPEVFLLDENRIVRYQGRVDAQFTFGSGVGLAQPNETRADLRIAIEEVLAGKPVSVPRTLAKGCLIGRVGETSQQPTVTYAKHISRLVQKHCLKCHREGQIAPFAMESFEDVAGWSEMIAEVVREQRMPPWHAGEKSTGSFLNDARLTQDEKELLYRWVDEGCPEGDPADLPAPRKFSQSWFTEGGFDKILYMSEKPVPVKAEGVEEYRYYELPGFQEDRWIKTAECLPGNHAAVHHIILYARPPGGRPIEPGATGISTRHFSFIAGFAPGTRPLDMPKGWARLIPAGYSLVFEMHYTPVGQPQTDRSAVGFVFAEREQVDRVLYTGLAINTDFKIPAFAANHRVDAEREFHRDTLVLALYPHMHVRGKSFRYELQRPGGEREILLDVPQYDFNWQNSYTFQEAMLVPRGSKLYATAHFDNSEGNLANPDPSQVITWGEQSWDEMMIGFYDYGVTIDEARQLLAHQAKELQAERDKRRKKKAGKERKTE